MLIVKCYRSAKMQKTDEHEVEWISAMPGPEEITDEDRESADGIMLCLNCTNGMTIFLPHSFLIEIREGCK